jgi:hypothetical protein
MKPFAQSPANVVSMHPPEVPEGCVRGVVVLNSKPKPKPKGKVRLTCDVERGAQKGIEWITFFSGKTGEVYDIMFTDPQGVWVKGKSSQVPIKLTPEEYAMAEGPEVPTRPHLRLI